MQTMKPLIATKAARLKDPNYRLHVYTMELWSLIPYYVARLCTGLRERGARVTVGTVRYHLDRKYFHRAGVALDPWLLDFGGGISSRLLRRIAKSMEYCLNLCLLALRLLLLPPNILHIQYLVFLERGLRFELWFVRWARFLRIPVVYTVHNVTLQNSRGKYDQVYRRVYRAVDALICHGAEAKNNLMKQFNIPEDKIWVIPHGPLFEKETQVSPEEARERLGLPLDEVLVLSFGVISHYKGIPYLLQSWKHVQAKGLRARLIIAGTGDPALLSEIHDLVKKHGLSATVDLRLRFITVDELPLLHQCSDILVYPYKEGTTSGALLTGLNYGKPIVATKLPFFQENLREGETALLVDYGDVDRLAHSLAELICDPQRRSMLAVNLAGRRNNRIEWGNIASTTLSCYRSLWEPRSSTGNRDLIAAAGTQKNLT
jgi:glycosyltransferase involved in cell wall biosynthesis